MFKNVWLCIIDVAFYDGENAEESKTSIVVHLVTRECKSED